MLFSSVCAQHSFKTTSTSVIGYLEYLPPDYHTNSNKYPVVIFLHGKGEKGADSKDPAVLATTIGKVEKLGPPMYVKNGTKFPFILISPQLKYAYGTWPSSYVLEVINHVKTYLRIDEKRISITGLSLGGGGTWVAAQDYPALFAAVAPVCGGYNSPSKACGIASENLPVWAFHGDSDGIVPMSKSINMVNAINNCTPKPSPLAKMTIYPGVGHSAWTNAYKNDHTVHNPNVYEWMMSFQNTINKGNRVPTANAGFDKSITIATTSSVSGTGTDADGAITSYLWTQLSGPATLTMTNATSSTVSVKGPVLGKYTLRLSVTDNTGNTDSDYVTINVVEAVNELPLVNAGADKILTLPVNAVALQGAATDNDGTIASYLWMKVSGGNAVLAGTTTNKLSVSAMLEGSYVFRLTATDNKGGKRYDDVTVTVKPATTSTTVGNQLPVANAGADFSVTLPIATTTQIFGSGTDQDGLIKYYKWAKVSGPYAYMWGVSKPTLQLSKLQAGTYVFRLTVTDNLGAVDTDEMTLIVRNGVVSATTSELETVQTIDERSISQVEETGSDVIIFNTKGEQLFQGKINSPEYRSIISHPGFYVYKIVREGNAVRTGKLFIR